MKMKTLQLANSNLTVSHICLGTMTTGRIFLYLGIFMLISIQPRAPASSRPRSRSVPRRAAASSVLRVWGISSSDGFHAAVVFMRCLTPGYVGATWACRSQAVTGGCRGRQQHGERLAMGRPGAPKRHRRSPGRGPTASSGRSVSRLTNQLTLLLPPQWIDQAQHQLTPLPRAVAIKARSLFAIDRHVHAAVAGTARLGHLAAVTVHALQHAGTGHATDYGAAGNS